VALRAREIVGEVKQAWAELYVVRKAIEINASTIALVRQASDIAAAKYSAGAMSQQDVLAGVVELSRLHEELVRILNAPEVRERILADGSEPVGSSPEEFRRFMLADLAKWAKVVKESGAKMD